ncbi:MAG TPA: DEAD/DEAH box helicase [Clostridium sp.]|nr:DEAD/DEAH box helicase [Clostridium sp.]
MDNISTYSSAIIKMLMDVREISYFELKRHFEKNKIYLNAKEINNFDFNKELDKLEEMGIISQDEGLIIFEGI